MPNASVITVVDAAGRPYHGRTLLEALLAGRRYLSGGRDESRPDREVLLTPQSVAPRPQTPYSRTVRRA